MNKVDNSSMDKFVSSNLYLLSWHIEWASIFIKEAPSNIESIDSCVHIFSCFMCGEVNYMWIIELKLDDRSISFLMMVDNPSDETTSLLINRNIIISRVRK